MGRMETKSLYHVFARHYLCRIVREISLGEKRAFLPQDLKLVYDFGNLFRVIGEFFQDFILRQLRIVVQNLICKRIYGVDGAAFHVQKKIFTVYTEFMYHLKSPIENTLKKRSFYRFLFPEFIPC